MGTIHNYSTSMSIILRLVYLRKVVTDAMFVYLNQSLKEQNFLLSLRTKFGKC